MKPQVYKARFPKQLGLVLFSTLLAVGVTACGGDTTTNGSEEQNVFSENIRMTGAGASFPAPLYQNWFVEMNQKHPQLEVNYQSVGSGAGVEQFSSETVDFGASDVAMTDEEITKIDRGVILLPMTAGSIVLTYNLPNVESGLKLTRDAYVNILLGKITNWSDPAIAQANPEFELPNRKITVVHRSDGSGTTGVFTKHLSAISEEWTKEIGEGKSVQWPTTQGTFVGGKGNEGVTAQVQQTTGAIGYVEYGYAVNNNLAMASLENASGNFIEPNEQTASATLAAVELPENLRAFITDPEGNQSYPVVTYTWMLAFEQYDDPTLAKAMEVMIEFGLNEGQEIAPQLGYIPLPKNVRERVAEAADKISPDYTITVR
ncbi:phosphate ABC transporter substrate-binding protein, PhoT family [Halothece sp. PCC 7418]|uniref:phosphate ABC transporter substrate-binding protein PstS n=1 Tax=Halothece sp. (strain PCC 7418) TaxID=65093 RepID=UPI0002A06F75|nr:phosphate ABC transporter substrate-binding protein PstS [Halothece sp. PCC 7418]AFZ43919.1 phosphate ABC transporter substrate-binding protein, PhoT family [Halothece sp. PCC 7418]